MITGSHNPPDMNGFKLNLGPESVYGEEIQKIRRMIIELLWPSWQPYAEEYGVKSSRFKTGMTDCSLCGLCLRYCADVKKANRIYFEGRGIDRKPALVEGSELQCRACGECFTLCGSGWIASRC